MSLSKVGRRGQVTLPRDVRLLLGLSEGDHVAFVRRGRDVLLQPLSRTLLHLRGSVPVPGPQDFTAVRREVLAERGRKVAQSEG